MKKYSLSEALEILKRQVACNNEECGANVYCDHCKYDVSDEEFDNALKAVIAEFEKQEADGCQGCAFTDVEEWEMPCRKCRRACKDYWRPKK